MVLLKGRLMALLEELLTLWQAGKPDLRRQRNQFVMMIRFLKGKRGDE